jgi:hypothetical protein
VNAGAVLDQAPVNGGIRFEARWDGRLVAITLGTMALVLVVAVTVVSMAARAAEPVVLGVAVFAVLPGLAGMAECAWWAPRAYSIDGAAPTRS